MNKYSWFTKYQKGGKAKKCWHREVASCAWRGKDRRCANTERNEWTFCLADFRTYLQSDSLAAQQYAVQEALDRMEARRQPLRTCQLCGRKHRNSDAIIRCFLAHRAPDAALDRMEARRLTLRTCQLCGRKHRNRFTIIRCFLAHPPPDDPPAA